MTEPHVPRLASALPLAGVLKGALEAADGRAGDVALLGACVRGCAYVYVSGD